MGSGLAQVALSSLAACGFTVTDPNAVSELEKALASKESGAEQDQCEDPVTAYLLFTNALPSEEQASECGSGIGLA